MQDAKRTVPGAFITRCIKLFAQGELVERGQLIGEVGSTGFSTGPHLHFTMSYYHSNIEPGYIIYGKSITKHNFLELMK